MNCFLVTGSATHACLFHVERSKCVCPVIEPRRAGRQVLGGIFLARFAGEMLIYTRCFHWVTKFSRYFAYFHKALREKISGGFREGKYL